MERNQIADDVIHHEGFEITVTVCGYLIHVEHFSCEIDFELAFHDVRQAAENPEPLNTNSTGMTFK